MYTENEFNLAKPIDELPCECYNCNNIFYITKHKIQRSLNKNHVSTSHFCSNKCKFIAQKTKQKINCTNCNLEFEKFPSQIKKSSNHYCNKSCAATYNNKNKKHGTKRSKLEIWLEEQLTILYPNLVIHFNRKDTIGSELDIYFPTLNLAIELNGIFHYEPIFGIDKLSKIQKNDKSKSKTCIDAKIDLCIIDTSAQKYFKPKTSQKYFDIIIKIVNERVNILVT